MGEILAEDQDQSFLMVKKKNDWNKNKKNVNVSIYKYFLRSSHVPSFCTMLELRTNTGNRKVSFVLGLVKRE